MAVYCLALDNAYGDSYDFTTGATLPQAHVRMTKMTANVKSCLCMKNETTSISYVIKQTTHVRLSTMKRYMWRCLTVVSVS